MGIAGLTVRVHVDQDFAREYTRALVGQRLGRWVGFGAAYVAWAALVIALYGVPEWGMTACLVICVSTWLYGEATLLRREARLPVGRDLVADFADVELRLHAPGFERGLAYANFRTLARDGKVMSLEDGLGKKTPLPSAIFTSEAEAWFRRHAHPRDFVAEPLPPGWSEIDPGPRIDRRLARAGVLRYELSGIAWPTAILLAVNAVLGFLISPSIAVLVGGFFVIVAGGSLAHQFSKLCDRLEFQYADQPVRVGPDGASWVIDSVNFRERIDPAEVTYFERRRGLVFLRHTTSGEKRSLVFPESWLAGLLSSARVHADSI